ncbi:Mu transposase domain-containing protein [Streptomyces ferrugineus]|uniref:Mu transposase domain-containing protein n=1 Tax=Streptomyces ferrugineus TaxID=1413221 RepID=UPI00389A036B
MPRRKRRKKKAGSSRCPRAVRDRPLVRPAGGPLRAGRCPRTNRYPVPVRLVGRLVRVLPHAREAVAYDGRTEVARHERLVTKGRGPARTRPLPGGPAAQTGRSARSQTEAARSS